MSGLRSSSARPLGRRHYCTTSQGHQLFHTYGDGAPRRKRCAYCGGQLAVLIGAYGVFTWRGDGRYRIEGAVRLFARERAADAYADEHGPAAGGLVVRWIVDPEANFSSEPRAAEVLAESDTEETA